MKRRYKYITGLCLIFLLLFTGYKKYMAPTKIAVISFPDFMVEKMERSNNNKWIKINTLDFDNLEKVKKYKLILVRGHGVRISPEQLEQLREAAREGSKVFVTDITNPEYDITNLKGEEHDYFSVLLENKCAANFQNLFNYSRKVIDNKSFFNKPYSEAVILPDDFLFHDNDELIFGSVNDYEIYYKESGYYKEGAPRVVLLAGNINIQNSNSEHTIKLINELENAGLNVFPIRSFGDKKFELLKDCNPDLVILRPHGRLAMGQQDKAVNWLLEKNIPVLAPLTVFSEYDKWLKSQQGMYGGMLSMSIVMPELDGAVAPYALVAKFRAASGNLMFDAIPGRVESFSKLVANWLELQKKDNSNKKIAVYYFKGPGQNSLVASNMEVIPSLYNFLVSLKREGYNLDGLPEDKEQFEKLLMKKGPVPGPYALGTFDNYLKNGEPELVKKDTYELWCQKELPGELYQQVVEKYGEAPGNYMNVNVDNQEYIAVTRVQFGNVCLLPQPLPGIGDDTRKLVHGAKAAPPHTYIASYFWARLGFQADAVFHFGTHGSLEFTPGKQVALSDYDWADRLIGTMPHFYIYTISNIGEGIIAKRRTYATLISYLTPPFMKSGLHKELEILYQKMDKYNSLPPGPVKEQYAHSIKKLAESQNIHKSIGLDSTKEYTSDELHKIHEYLEEIEEEKVTAGLYTLGVPYTESKTKETVTLMAIDPIAFGLAELDGIRGKIKPLKYQDNFYVSEYYRPKALNIIKSVLNGRSENDIVESLLTSVESELAQKYLLQPNINVTSSRKEEKKITESGLENLIVELSGEDKNVNYIKSLKSVTKFNKSSKMLDASYRARAVKMAEKMKSMAPEMYEAVSILQQEKMLQLIEIMQDSLSRLKVFELVEDKELKFKIETAKTEELKNKAKIAESSEYLHVIESVFKDGYKAFILKSDKKELERIYSVIDFYIKNKDCFKYCNKVVNDRLEGYFKEADKDSILHNIPQFIQARIDDLDKQEARYINAILKVENSIRSIKEYYSDLSGSPLAELKAVSNALDGGYTAPSSGGDPIANPLALPTGRNMYSVNAEATPSDEAWIVGKRLANSLLENELKVKGHYPEKISFTLWSTNFISTEGATIAQILYLLGVEPVRDGFGTVRNLKLIPAEELGRPRIDVVVQTSGQLRDLAASRLELIHKAVEMAAGAGDIDSLNYVKKGIRDAEKYMLDKGFSPLEARKFSRNRIFGGVNGNYGTGIMGLVEKGDAWENEKQIADRYINNMGAVYDNSEEWGNFKEGIFEAALQNTEVVVHPRSGNTWGALSLDHVYEFMGGLNLTVRNVTGNEPSAYFNDFRNVSNPRMQELKEAIGVETNSTIFNPKYIKELLDGEASSMETFAETFRNTYGWNVMKPEAIDDYIWNTCHEIYIKDKYKLEVKKRFEDENPYALQEMTSVMLETARKGYWNASKKQLAELASLHAELIRNYKAGCSGFVCDNAELRDFIAKNLNQNEAEHYQKNIKEVREVKIEDNAKNVVLKKEEETEKKAEDLKMPEVKSKSGYGIYIISALILLVLVLFIIKTKRKND